MKRNEQAIQKEIEETFLVIYSFTFYIAYATILLEWFQMEQPNSRLEIKHNCNITKTTDHNFLFIFIFLISCNNLLLFVPIDNDSYQVYNVFSVRKMVLYVVVATIWV